MLLAQAGPFGYDILEVSAMRQIGKNIKKYRAQMGMTQDQLAEKLHVTRQAVSNWENGKTQPSIETLTAMGELFGVSVEMLIYGKTGKMPLPVGGDVGAGAIFGGLFLLFMTVFLLGGAVIFTNGWGLIITVSLALSALITALIKLSDKVDALEARLDQLEEKG